MEPARLARLIRGELDWIVMRALEKDRVRRYDTPSALARDIQRYLSGDPVEAGPPSATYRLRKFARKYRPWLLAASASAALLVLATAVSAYQAIRATRAERVAQSERNRALEAERVAKEQTERALKAEQIARAELEKAATQVRRIKDATVYVKTRFAGKTVASGTAVVVEATGDSVLLATSRHAAVPDLAATSGQGLAMGSAAEIHAVFMSGQGPEHEQTLPANLIAASTSDDPGNELAFLIVNHVPKPPSPINLMNRLDPTDGMACLGAGFASGHLPTAVLGGKETPAIITTRGALAAIERDQYGQLTSLQMDEALMPGDGGPVVEERTGTLIGVIVGHVPKTPAAGGVTVVRSGSHEQIALLISADEIRRALAGGVSDLDVALESISKETAELKVSAELVDPRGMIKSVQVQVAPAEALTIAPYNDGSWPPLGKYDVVTLPRDPTSASASGRVPIRLSDFGDSKRIVIQTSPRYQTGQIVYSKPSVYNLPEKPGRIYPLGTPLARILKAAQRESFALLGPLVDPDRDCRQSRDHIGFKIKFDVPGEKLHTLDPAVVTISDKKKALHNAPMILAPVDGDFAALVEVTGELSPGLTLPENRQGYEISSTFQGAGLLLYQDKDNFIRFEKTASVAIGAIQPVQKVLLQVVTGGKEVERETYPLRPGGPANLLVLRDKGRLVLGVTGDIATPIVQVKEFASVFPSKINIGLSAANISAAPLTATFENFALLNDVSIIKSKIAGNAK
jgi:hypothetical protein